jgi:hypothetical protein
LISSSSLRSAISVLARSSSATRSHRLVAIRPRATVKAIAAREMACSRPDLTCLGQPLGSQAEHSAGMGGRHGIRFSNANSQYHNVRTAMELVFCDRRREIAGPVQSFWKGHPLHQWLRRICCLLRRSDCYRLEPPVAGWELHPLDVDAFARRTVFRHYAVTGGLCLVSDS